MAAQTILIAGPQSENLRCWANWLRAAGLAGYVCDTPEQVERVRGQTDLLLLGVNLLNASHWLLLPPRIRVRSPGTRIVILAIESSEDLAIQALRAGVDDYIRAPITASTLLEAVRVSRHLKDSHSMIRHRELQPVMLGESQSVQNLRKRLERLSATNCNVLITGESGTGKELAALAIHRHSSRSHAPLVCVNCAAIPDALVESELFGHEKGAFTGAESRRDGKLKAADGGVIFLDEVGDLSPYAQAKILRAVDTKEIYRLGSHQPISVDVRIVVATHRNLEEMVAQGKFRQDLFFRLNVGRVHIEPLRDRMEDLGLLLNHYLQELNRNVGTDVKGFSEEAWKLLIHYPWPGNVRELKNLVESVLVNSVSPLISAEELPAHFHRMGSTEPPNNERNDMMQALVATRWNKTKAAERLRWSRMTLYRKMAKYAVSRPKTLTFA